MKFRTKSRFLRKFRKRYSLRLHMVAILLATACSGVLASKILLAFNLNSLVIRYPLAVLLAYVVFFLCVKLWLVYVSSRRHGGSTHIVDYLDLPTPGSGGSSGGVPTFRGGGGHFSGAGASSSFDVHAAGDHTSVVGDAASGAAKGVGDAIGGAADALGDEGGPIAIVVIVVLAVLVATILGAAIYVIYEAPVILSEAAFEGLLAASLIKRARSIDQGDWVGSILKATWIPFCVTFIIAGLAGLILHFYFPAATHLIEILRRG